MYRGGRQTWQGSGTVDTEPDTRRPGDELRFPDLDGDGRADQVRLHPTELAVWLNR
jgi:hypothetical protein